MGTNDPLRLFTLTPAMPTHEIEVPEDDVPYSRAFVNFRNIHLLAFGGSKETTPSLNVLAKENWMYFSSTGAAAADEDDEMIQNWEHSPLIEIMLQVMNTEPVRQVLLRVRLVALGPNGRVRVAMGRRVTGDYNIPENEDTTLSLLLPVPADREWTYIDIKHIRQDNGDASALKVYEIAGFLA